MRQKGSHVSFKKAGAGTITLPLLGGRKVKGVYVHLVLERLGLDE
jgi:predicted RNA binding protein YcfA (HicA-like mRNA interferase family)